jgi:hypothetical protein
MITKYTNCEIIEVKSADERLDGNSKLSSFDHIPKDTYRTNDGYLYVKVRAISSRVNKNFDGWPVHELAGMEEKDFRTLAKELEGGSKESSAKRLTFTKDSANIKSKGDYGFKTFIGRPIFIDHNNSDPQRARGVIVDAMLHIESPSKISSDSYWGKAPNNHKPETWIELLLEVDGKAFPKLAKALTSGHVNAVSMGCNVEYTVCSVCDHEAANIDEYCDHIRKKGTTFKTGNVEKLAYEDCYNVNFFEISAVFDPADVTALFTEPVIKSASNNEDLTSFGQGENRDNGSFGWGEAVDSEEREAMDEFLSMHEDIMIPLEDLRIAFQEVDTQEFEEKSLILQELFEKFNQAFPGEPEWKRLLEGMKMMHITGLNYLELLKSNPDDEFSMNALESVKDEFMNYLSQFMDTIDGIQSDARTALQYDEVSRNRMQRAYDKSPSSEDIDALLDMGIDPRSISIDIEPKRTLDFKGMKSESKKVETKVSSSSLMKHGDSITAPNTVNTLKSEKPCPIGLAGECGLDDESGRCEKCGYREPPAPLDDPDLSKARDFDRQKEEQKDEFRDETKDLIDQLKRTLSKNERRSVNSKMNDKKTKITLTANVEEVPSDSKLADLGWIIPTKEAGVASRTVPVIEDGQPASDRPKEQKVISDQTKPVESTTKVALGELPGLAQPSGGDSAPQFSGDKNNESTGINEHQPAETAEQYQKVKRPVEEPQFAEDATGINEHQPSETQEQYQKVKKEDAKPQFSGEGGTGGITEHHPGKQSHESSILSAIKLADLEVELGLNDAEMKYARVAELENEDISIVQAKYETLSKIKEAGLMKREASSSMKLASFPSLKGVKESSVTSSGSFPDDALFN